METKKKLLAIFSGIGIIFLVLGLYAFKSAPLANEGYAPQPPWENLKVLPKDISKDSLNGLMKNYALSLGVKCNHCHVPSKTDPTELDFSSDAKIEKEIARGMIKMTDDINENNFKPYFPDPKPQQVHVVNCVMCHRGTANPEKHLAQMGKMYKTYDPDRDNRKEKILEAGEWKE
ncbi:c-type cytochrome [Aequorivita marina]|uniref:c-type cytochrome n=1 Tax=Aequorivita marina TaxID=3073654 RepID=UPI0028762039|nr:c-type cytochrome [Aequorivita sp. S2608]MDS1299102.1 c-type cytochrome [Aequorivita sp. S2608]